MAVRRGGVDRRRSRDLAGVELVGLGRGLRKGFDTEGGAAP